jgi:hypothetical protein
MPSHVSPPTETTEWRHLSDFLWAGSGPHGPVGTVERGRRFKAVDPSGELVSRCRALHEAQSLLEHLAERPAPGSDRDRTATAA